MTLPERLAREALPAHPQLLPAVEAAIREAIEACAEITLSWPLDPENMLDAKRYAEHGWANAVSGVLRAKVAAEIRALLTEEETP